MDTVLAGKLGYGVFPGKGVKCYTGLELYWFSVNWKFPMSELTYSAKGDFDEKEALQLSA